MLVLTRARILDIRLLGVRSFTFISPEVTALRLCQEWILGLGHDIPIRRVANMLNTFFNWNYCFVGSWTRTIIFDFKTFRVWHRALENKVLASRVKLLFDFRLMIIKTRSWIWFLSLSWFENLSFEFWRVEVIVSWFRFNGCRVWVVSSWSNNVLTIACICCLCEFLWRNTWRLCRRNYGVLLVVHCVIFIPYFVQHFLLIPFYFQIVWINRHFLF